MPNFGIAPNLSATDISVTSVPNYKNTQVTEEHTAVKAEPTCEVEEIKTEEITIMPNCRIAPNLSATDISVTSVPNYKNTQVTEEHTAVKVEPTCEVDEINTEEICTVTEEEEIFENIIDKKHTEKQILLETGRTKICNKTLSHQASLQYYIRTHNGKKPYVCNICCKSFFRTNNLLNHMRTHTGEKPYDCNICSKSFSRQDLLQRHTRTHTGEKPYECRICNKTFSRQGDLQCHIKTHTGIGPHVCDICSKSFFRPMNLLCHMRTHTGEKPYDCNICSKSFSRQDHLQRHMRTHTGEKPHVCNICTEKVHDAVTEIHNWTKRWKIKLNESKIHINFTNKKEQYCPVVINNKIIPYANTAKYLGVTLDAKLRWKAHVKKKKEKIELRYKRTYWLLDRTSDLSVQNKVILYKQVLMPVWTYGIQLWRCTKKTNIQIIQRFQNKVLRGIVNAPYP